MHQKRNNKTKVKILHTFYDYTTMKNCAQFEFNLMKNGKVYCHADMKNMVLRKTCFYKI